ncbi:MAG TPA: aminoglycoside phosphotransferase family protein [Nocardioidaceae bacterium]|nr:aminoglycoside phosphotransferase family protein [Nocardioidaceae bacterium]
MTVPAAPRGSMEPGALDLLADALSRLDDGYTGAVLAKAVELRPDVHRIELSGSPHGSVVAKRIRSKRAQLERRVTDRWLPAVGLAGFGPPRLAAAAEPDGLFVWHVYEDLGPHGLDRESADETAVRRAMDRLADLHAGFARSPLLPEVRFAAGDLGAYFYTRSVRDAAATIERMRPPYLRPSDEEAAVRDAVLARLHALLDDEPARVELIEQMAGPETLVHGDLTRENVFVLDNGSRPAVRLIDWDHVGVAPAGFDLSTHLAYYPPALRTVVLDAYTTAMADRGFPFRDGLDWDLLVSTFEAGRLANQLIWLSIGILEGNGWTFDGLADWGRALAASVDPPGTDLDESLRP